MAKKAKKTVKKTKKMSGCGGRKGCSK